MAKIKNARSGEYMISQNAEGAIKVAKDYENDKEDSEWTQLMLTDENNFMDIE